MRFSDRPWEPAPATRPVRPLPFLVTLLLLAAAYYASARIGLSLAAPWPSATPIWPPTGLSIAVLTLSGLRLWPAVWAGAFAVILQLSGDALPAAGIACGNTLEAVLGAYGVRRLGGSRAFEGPKGFLGLLGVGAGACAVSAGISVLTLGLAGAAPAPGLGLIGITWWVGDVMSAWVLVSLILLGRDAWRRRGRPWAKPSPARLAEAAGLAAWLLAANMLVFGGVLPEPWRNAPVAFATLPTLLWAAFRFGRLATATALAAQTVIAVWGTARGFGPFSTQGQSYLLLQMFLGTGLVSFLLLAVVVRARAAVEARLRESERRIEGILASVPGIVWESTGDPAGPSHRITYVSEYAERLLGYPAGEWLVRRDLWIAMVHPDERDRVSREAAEAFAGGRGGTSAFRCVARDGRVVDVEIRAAVVRDGPGNPVGMRGFLMDVSDRRRAEEKLRSTEDQLRQAQKMEAVGRLAGGVAHDFNNLLTAVNGYSDLLLGQLDADHPMREFALEIRGAGERAAALTRQLLAFSRKEVVQPRVIDVNGVVGDMQRLLGRLIGEDIRLRTSLDPALLKVKADPDQVGQILLNLVVNGRDAMSRRGGALDIETANVRTSGDDPGFYLKPRPGPCVRLTVRDSGTGMGAEVMAHLFEPFFTTKDSSRGTGLGLSTVYGILERMGGGIRVESAPGHGSSFHVYFPALREGAGPGYAGRSLGSEVRQGAGSGTDATAGAAPASSASRAR